MTESPRTRAGDARLRDAHAQGGRDRSSRVSAPKQPWSPPQISPTEITSHQFVPPDAGEEAPRPSRGRLLPTDEPFQRFYSTFEGLISKLSAPLAFAGLPLGSDVSAGQPESNRQKSAADTKLDRYNAVPDRTNAPAEPDVNKIFSRAALRAIRDTNGGGTPGSAAESFYVVPTTGGTVSYAGILSRADKEARRNSSGVEDGDEDFVDARETPSSPEMLHSLSGGKGKTSRGAGAAKTMEELQMENQALRHLSDNLSKRLHMWEVNAQSSSMALQQSLKAIHNQNAAAAASASPTRQPSPAASTLPPLPQGGPASPASPVPWSADQRIKELEELVRRSEKELEKVGRENEKLKTVLGRYRERWEKLKEGAKTRRSGEASASSNQTGGGAASATTASIKRSEDVPASPAPASTPSPAPTSVSADMKEQGAADAGTEGGDRGEVAG